MTFGFDYSKRVWKTLPAVEEALRRLGKPSTVREIIDDIAGSGLDLPTKSKTPESAVARDLAMDIKHNKTSRFMRTAPGRFALR